MLDVSFPHLIYRDQYDAEARCQWHLLGTQVAQLTVALNDMERQKRDAESRVRLYQRVRASVRPVLVFPASRHGRHHTASPADQCPVSSLIREAWSKVAADFTPSRALYNSMTRMPTASDPSSSCITCSLPHCGPARCP